MGVGWQARGWGWRHPGRRAWAVRDLDLEVAAGERVLLLGPSGSGKSTLLLGLAGLLDPDLAGGDDPAEAETGALLVGGLPARRARAAGRRVGLLLQDPDAQTVLARVGDDVAFGLENAGTPAGRIPAEVARALAQVGLGHLAPDHPTSRLSTGQRQRLALAGVLAPGTDLLLLDEPTAMLDPDGAVALRDAVAARAAAGGATLVVVEHRVDLWLPVVDRAVVLGPGGMIADGADGDPAGVLERRRAQLVAAGVWLPGPPPVGPSVRAVTPGPVLLSARDLAAARPASPGTRAPEPVVTDVRLDLRAGDALALTGPNGSGKTTLLHVLSGLVRPAAGALEAGSALAAGRDRRPWRWSSRDLLIRIQTVFAEPRHQFLTGTVLDEVALGPRRAGDLRARERAGVVLERLGLSALAPANPWTLSGGEQRRLSVATALATRPRVLALDEPTFGQDARTWAALVHLLRELLADGTAVVTATHDRPLAAALDAEERRLPTVTVPTGRRR
ncbi:MAG: ABC transporter ATP-binding protein [Kineosporiaceae bacterium]